MKRMLVFGLLLCTAAVPATASAAMPLAASQNQRQAIMDTEYTISVPPSMSTAAVAAAQARVAQLQTQINGSDVPQLGVPAYGGCDSDQGVLSYLEDQVSDGNLDEQSLYTDKRNIYDLEVNLQQRGCPL